MSPDVQDHGWYDDGPATEAQIETIRRDLEVGPRLGGAAFARQAVRKLLAAYDEMKGCRDAAVRFAEREHVPIQIDDEIDIGGEILLERIQDAWAASGYEQSWWSDWSGGERICKELLADVLGVVRPHLARLTDLTQAARAELNQLLEEKAAAFVDATTMFRGLNIRDGQAHLEIEPAREMILVWCASVRAMLDEYQAQNYVETHLEMPRQNSVSLDIQDGQNPVDSYTLILQRRYGKTPHQFRLDAERERDELRERAEKAERELAKAVEERDLAIAHDRQPYPTAWAYEQACAALNKQRDRAEAAEARLAEIGETREEWGFGDHPDRVTVPLAQGYRNGTSRQWAEDGAQRNHVKVWTRSVGPWREVNEEAGRG